MSANFTPEKEDLKILTPFKMQVLTNFPYIEADFDALTNYQLLCKVVEYLNNVIAETNEVTEQTLSLYNAYVALQDYVNQEIGDFETTVNNRVDGLETYMDNYFNNLDVQQEINNKLDAMALDGSLTSLISGYVDPIYSAYENQINDTINAQQVQINSIASGSPAGVYETVSDLTTADPDHSKIYVVTADGKWYYYTNSTWTAGGTYQSTGIADGSITGIKTNFLNESLNILKLEDKTGTQFGIDYTISDGVITLDGTATNTFYIYDNIKNITPHGAYRIKCYNDVANSGVQFSVLSDDTPEVYCSCSVINGETINFLNGNNFVRIGIRIANGTVIDNLILKPALIRETEYKSSYPFIKYDDKLSTDHIVDIGKNIITPENTTFMTQSYNLADPTKIVSGFCRGSSYGVPTIESSSSYKCITLYNNVNETTRYYVYPRCRMYVVGSVKTTGVATDPTETLNDTETHAPLYIDVPAYGRVVVTFYAADSKVMIAKSSTALPYVPFSYTIPYLNNSNILYGKKLVTCGDSFTEYTNATFDSGPYSGKDKTWPYLIGLRNNMIVNNMAKSGSTMAINDYHAVNFADELYTQIPADADYIIIKYGINDVNGNTPIGTINSTDDTTFYGAWNKVMSYIIANHPTAKIGIIVTNGLALDTSAPDNSNYAHAIIEIAKKYGIPTLNEWNDPNVPLLLRTGRTDVIDAVKTVRTETFRVSSDNTHENYICQEYESTFIEDFLRRL